MFIWILMHTPRGVTRHHVFLPTVGFNSKILLCSKFLLHSQNYVVRFYYIVKFKDINIVGFYDIVGFKDIVKSCHNDIVEFYDEQVNMLIRVCIKCILYQSECLYNVIRMKFFIPERQLVQHQYMF